MMLDSDRCSQFYWMQPQVEEQALPMTNFKPPRKHHSDEVSTPTDSLPSINSKSIPKANAIRNQVNASKLEIIQLEAKLNHLRKVREHNELQNQRNLTRINFVNSIKERVYQDHQQKQQHRKNRDQSLEKLKNRVGKDRSAMKSDLEQAKERLQKQKEQEAEEERRKHRQVEYLIQKCREIEQSQNVKRVQKVKEEHDESFSRVMEFKVDRVASSKNNYQQRVKSNLKEREKASSLLQKLKAEEQRLLVDVKRSESITSSSRAQLSTINPQKRRKRSTRSERFMKSGATMGHELYTLEEANSRS